MSDSRDPSQPDPKPAGSSPAPAAPVPEAADDAGSQALAEALRSSFAIVKVVMVILILVFLGSGFFVVGPQEKAVILRLGKTVGEGDRVLLGSGPHWAFPYPIDEVVRIPVGQAQVVTSTIGWYATTAAQEAAGTEPPAGDSLNPAFDGYLLTADANIIHARGTLRYRISEPGLRYRFDFVSASNLVQNALNNALLFAAARYTVDDALTRDVAGFREKVRDRLEQLISQQQLGVTVDQIELKAIHPRFLNLAFASVSETEQKRSKAILDARSHANETISKAGGTSAIQTNAAAADRARLVDSVAAEADQFNALLPKYEENPVLFTRLRQLEALQRILTNATDKMVLPESVDGKPVDLRIQLNREAPKRKTEEPIGAEDKH